MRQRHIEFEAPAHPLAWVRTMPAAPYFETDDRQPWHPIGANDAISWAELGPLFRRRDVPAVDAYLGHLATHGVTVLRVMLEYAQVRHRYFERSLGVWSPPLVQFWDDLFRLCERHGLRLLLTPFDTFWMWIKFRHHPYSHARGGPLTHPSRLLISPEVRAAIKARLAFAAERWGGSGALFAWDLWNEIHPAQAEMDASPFAEFIEDLSTHVREVEQRCFGRSHLQTVSLFGPELKLKAHMQMEHAIFRHPSLDFATIHVYEHGTIDDPRNTVDAALGMGRIVRESLAEIDDNRPFLDTEHGPIHSFKDHHKTLAEDFDDEYFTHMQWAHLASGGAGGGMRWPNRHPHQLTDGMRRAQLGLARFAPLIDWSRFARRNVTADITLLTPAGKPVGPRRVARFACATDDQAIVYLLRRDAFLPDRRISWDQPGLPLALRLPMLAPGRYRITTWDTGLGIPVQESIADLNPNALLPIPGPLIGDLVLAITRL